MKQQDVERNREPLNRYKSTFREQGGKLDKSTPEGIAAWGIRKVMAMNPTTAGDERLAALETWEWDTTMRMREVAALEQIAQSVEAQRLNHVASLTVGELMAALQPLMDGEADTDDDYAELDTETHEDTNADRTDYYTLLLEDGMRATVTTWQEDGSTGFYVGFPDDDLFASNPTALHDLADRFRSYARAFDHVAALWDADRRTGVIPTKDAAR